MRLSPLALSPLLSLLLISVSPPTGASGPEPSGAAESPADPAAGEPAPEDDLLGELVVEANKRGELILPKIAVVRPPDGDLSFLHELLARDLELSGEFELVEVEPRLGFDDAFEPEPFVALGLEAVVTADVQRRSDGRFDLAVRVFLPAVGELAAWSKTTTVTSRDGRLAGHRLADGVIGALTGTDGPFASRLVLVRTEGKARRAYLVDPDGRGLTPLSPSEQLVVTATLDADAQAYWAASERNGSFRLYREGEPGPLAVAPAGSIYGIALSPVDGTAALAIAVEDTIQLFTGTLPPHASGPLTAKTKLDFALSPTFAPDGRLVYAGTRGKRRSVYVGTKAVSAPELAASSPTVCDHPDGPRLIYAVGLGKNTDLVASELDGSAMTRLTWGRGRNYAPACSPDGRLVAFFSTRSKDGGPGLYLMRVDGRRPKRVSAAVGDVLVWARIPSRAAPAKPASEPEPEQP